MDFMKQSGKESRSEGKSSPWVFLGVDLARLPRLWMDGWREALASRWLSRLIPPEPVDVRFPSGECRRYRAGKWEDCPGRPARHRAVMLDDATILTRRLEMPPLTGRDLERAVAFRVDALTPFGMEETAWGFMESSHAERSRPGGQGRVVVALASIHDINRQIGESPEAGENPEIWASTDDGYPVVLRGYGEQRRYRGRRNRLIQAILWGMLALGLSLALFAVPAFEAKVRLAQAQASMATLQEKVQDIQAARERLVKRSGQAEQVALHLEGASEPLRLVDRLSALLPRTTYVEQLTVTGQHARMTGQSDNASALLGQLGDEPDFHNVRAPTGITRSRATGKDRFVIEFDFRPGGDS